jgi:hypothetical protein
MNTQASECCSDPELFGTGLIRSFPPKVLTPPTIGLYATLVISIPDDGGRDSLRRLIYYLHVVITNRL